MDAISVYTYVYSDIGNRKENEDTAELYVYKRNMVAVVADGLGGQGDGKAASELVCRHLLKCGAQDEFVSRDALSSAFAEANEALLKKQKNSLHMKTTAVCLCIQENRAIWAHIGDSRLYHFYNGELCEYTLDHSVSQLAVTLGEICRRDIPKHPGRSRLYHAMGTEGEEPEIHEPVRMERGRHAFLLCSDGFWEYLTDQEIMDELRNSGTAKEWVLLLRERIQGRCGENHDNNSAIAVILEV